MKRYAVTFMILTSFFILSVPAMAAPSIPRFISGTSVTVPYQAFSDRAQALIDYCSNPVGQYMVAVSSGLSMGLSSGETLKEESGKFQYLHFIAVDVTSKEIEIYKVQNGSRAGALGISTGFSYPMRVLTFQYDPLTNSFDGGTLYESVSRGLLFDYIIDCSAMKIPSTVYPNYKMIGNISLNVPSEFPGYNYFLKIKTDTTPNTTHTITINYVYENGKTAASTVQQKFSQGTAYKITSPAISGFYPTYSIVTGTMGQSDVTYRVTYIKNDGYQNKTKKLTIEYVFEDGSKAWDSNLSDRTPGYLYSVNSPRIPGYSADRLIVSGYMPGIDWTETVVYKKIDSGQPDPPDYFYLTVEYLRRDGSMMTSPVYLRLVAGASYYVRSPIFSYFRPDQLSVSGKMPNNDLTITVYYDETDSPNEGEGDKDDGAGGGSGGQGGGSSSSGGSGGSSGNSSGDSSGSSSGGSSSGGHDSSDPGGSSGGGSSSGSSGGSSSGGSSGGSGSSGGGSSSGGGGSGSSGGSSGGGDSSDLGNCGCGSNCGGSCGCGSCSGGGCPGGGYWYPDDDSFNDLFPNESEPSNDFPPWNLFDPDDYDYTPPSSSEYNPLEGIKIPDKMPRYPTTLPPIGGGGENPFLPPDKDDSGNNPFEPPKVEGGGNNPFLPPQVEDVGMNPFAPVGY